MGWKLVSSGWVKLDQFCSFKLLSTQLVNGLRWLALVGENAGALLGHGPLTLAAFAGTVTT
jgi:hypothetical protein